MDEQQDQMMIDTDTEEKIHIAGVVATRGDWSMEVERAQSILAASSTMVTAEQKSAACHQAQTFALVAIAKSLERLAAKG